MKIQVGEIYMDKVTQTKTTYPNKTRKYLLPCLKHYGEPFIHHINSVFKVAVGIGDFIVDKCGVTHEKHIFILLDTKIANPFFKKFITWIKEQPMYEDDYVFDNIQKSTYHMVVLKFPEQYYSSFQTFKQGKYSQMFNQETIDLFFEKFPDVKKVLIKDHSYRIEFTKKLNKVFELNGQYQILPIEWEGELDFPPNSISEKFNHNLKDK